MGHLRGAHALAPTTVSMKMCAYGSKPNRIGQLLTQTIVGYIVGSVAGLGIGLLVTIAIALPIFPLYLVYQGYKEMDKP